MHQSGPGAACRLEQLVGPQVALGSARRAEQHGLVGQRDVGQFSIGLGIDGDRPQRERFRGTDDAAGDFAAVGNEQGRGHDGISRLWRAACLI